jgi:hypothetical protein
MTRRALEATRPDRRAEGVVQQPATRPDAAAHPMPAPLPSDWPRLVSALSATDEDDLPLFGRFPG